MFLERWQRITIVLVLIFLLLGGLNLTANAIQQLRGEDIRVFALDLNNREVVLLGHPYQVGAFLEQGRNRIAHFVRTISSFHMK